MRKQLHYAKNRKGKAIKRELALIEEAKQIKRDLAATTLVLKVNLVSNLAPYKFNNRLAITMLQQSNFNDFDQTLLSTRTIVGGPNSS